MTTVVFDKNAGLCPGVKRTIIAAISVSKKEKHIVSYGELIHNPHVVSYLAKNGIGIAERLTDIHLGQFVLVRAHGIPPQEEAFLNEHGIKYLDLTCPRVKAVHRKIIDFRDNGYRIIIVGKSTHPETIGHMGYAGACGRVVESVEDVDNSECDGRCVVLAQTTISKKFFTDVVERLRSKCLTIESVDTICTFSIDRQEWIDNFSKRVDCSLIIGGKKSSNTEKLYEIAKRNSEAVWIEDPSEIDFTRMLRFERIAVTAGTSTPSDFLENTALILTRAGAIIEYV
jgi:4-hydroxy-3-methylbut-2-enyl diphosphate reductase